jgi:hypothetical protein
MPALNLTELNAALRSVDARWEATQPSEEHQLGFVPGPEDQEDHSFEEREHLSRANYTRFMAMTAAAAAAPLYPPAIDWRTFRPIRHCRPETT